MSVFYCPKCGWRDEQPRIVKGCSHPCPADRGRMVEMMKEQP